VKAGKLRPLVSMSAERSTAFPDVPTLKEVGYPGVEYYQWSGVFVPAKTPEAVVKVLSEAVAKAAKDPAFIGAMEKLGASVDYQDAAAFAPWWDADSRKTEETVQAIGKVQ
jgi:tripartite-type tricarboxylate transporter receptor subunit TctC